VPRDPIIERMVVGASVDIYTPLGHYSPMLGRPVSVIELPGYRRRG
jgi:hypothetical protein